MSFAKSRFFSMLTIASVLTINACATTRVVSSKPGRGGEIMVREGMIGDARADANAKMRSNCGSKKPKIIEEREAVIGSKHNSRKSLTDFGSETSGETENKTEWRIKYKCGRA